MMPYPSGGSGAPFSGPGGSGSGSGSGSGGTESAEPSALSQLSESINNLDPLAAMEKSMQDTVRCPRGRIRTSLC